MPFDEIKLVHANDRLDALLSGTTQAAALMEPLVSRALDAGARKIADLRWRGGIVAGNDVDEETAAEAAPRAQPRDRLAARERGPLARELLRDLEPEQREHGLMPELVGVRTTGRRVSGKGRLDDRSRLPERRAGLRRRRAQQIASLLTV